MRKALPFVVGAAVIAGCVGMGANAAYGTGNPGQEHAQNHTTVLWEYTGYPDITKPQPYVDSVRGADIHAFDEYVKQPGMCGKTFQVDVYKTVVKGNHVSTLWSKGYLEYAHDGGFLAYNLGYTPYKVLTGKDTECAPTTTPEPTTPVVTPEPTPTDTPTLPPTTPPSTGTPEPEPTDTATPQPSEEPTSPVTSTPTTPTEPGTTAPSPTASVPPSPGGETPAPSTEPTPSQTPSGDVTPTNTPTSTTSATPSVPTKTDTGTTPTTRPTEATARTLAYTGISAVGPLIAAGVLVILGAIGLLIARKRKGL